MECDICSRESTSPDELICITCARSSVYLTRLETARIILESEQLKAKIQAVIDPSIQDAPESKDLLTTRTTWQAEIMAVGKSDQEEKITNTKSHMDVLRQEIEKMRQDIAQRKGDLSSRKQTLEAINSVVPLRRQASIDTITEIRDKGTNLFTSVNNRSITTRAFLCREAATLLRLKQRRKSRKGTIYEQYSITGMILPDLRDINNVRCSEITAALASVAHLLILISFYLGVRLPAEITTAHRDYPLPTINTPSNSYTGHKVAFPGSDSLGTTPSSPFSSKHDISTSHRPRPLFIGSDDHNERVSQVAKRDPTAFNFFIEGVSLLAWNVAWLNRSQGFNVGTTTWENICDIGRNIWQLTLAEQSSSVMRVLSSRDAKKTKDRTNNSSSPGFAGETAPIQPSKLGHASHLSAHSFLGQAAYNEQTRTWRYARWNSISDSLKKHLITEMNNAEWEVLQEQEWDDGGEQFDEAVFVKNRNMTGHEYDDARSIMTTRTQLETIEQDNDSGDGTKQKGTSGWTKLKERSKDKS